MFQRSGSCKLLFSLFKQSSHFSCPVTHLGASWHAFHISFSFLYFNVFFRFWMNCGELFNHPIPGTSLRWRKDGKASTQRCSSMVWWKKPWSLQTHWMEVWSQDIDLFSFWDCILSSYLWWHLVLFLFCQTSGACHSCIQSPATALPIQHCAS